MFMRSLYKTNIWIKAWICNDIHKRNELCLLNDSLTPGAVWLNHHCGYVMDFTENWMLLRNHGPLARYVKFRVAHAPGMPGTFSPPPRVSNPDMHYGTCVTHVSWCIPGLLPSSCLWSRWRGKRSRHSLRMPTCNFTFLARCQCRNLN